MLFFDELTRLQCDMNDVDAQYASILLDESFMTSDQLPDDRRFRINLGHSNNVTEVVPCWTEPLVNSFTNDTDYVQFCLAIGLVCNQVVQTGGAGDNVSGKIESLTMFILNF